MKFIVENSIVYKGNFGIRVLNLSPDEKEDRMKFAGLHLEHQRMERGGFEFVQKSARYNFR